MRYSSLRHALRALPALLGLLLVMPPAQAQVGGLIKKKVKEAVDKEPPAPPPEFDETVLELTPERLRGLIAGKRAGKRIADGPNGPEPLVKKRDAIGERIQEVDDKHRATINAWQERLSEAESCVLEKLHERTQQIAQETAMRGMSDQAFSMKLLQLTQAITEAMQKGDTAQVTKLSGELKRLGEPTSADTAAAKNACAPKGSPPAAWKEWTDLNDEHTRLGVEITAAEEAIRRAEDEGSGMDAAQRAIACERITVYLGGREEKRTDGFTETELKALEKVWKELAEVCYF